MEDTKASLCGQQGSSLQATNSDPELKIKVGDRMKELHSAEQINKKASGSKQGKKQDF
jgi:histidinol phosphatase-like enzyme